MKMRFIVPAVLLGAWAVSAGACSQEDRALFCTGAKVALQIGEDRNYSPEDIAMLRKNVDTLCAFLSPAELQRAEEAAIVAVPVEE